MNLCEFMYIAEV